MSTGASTWSDMPEASVVIPTRDRPDLLHRTLASVTGQRGVAMEVIVVDDGSVRPVAETLSTRDARVRVLRNHSSHGVSNARNRGIREARGQWLAFCDDDDLWAPDKLRRQLEAARASGRVWVIGGAVDFEDGGILRYAGRPPVPEEALRRLRIWNCVPGGCSNVVVHRDLLAATGLFDPHLANLADWDLWVRLARRELPAVVHAPLVAYRLHCANMSGNVGTIHAELPRVQAATADLRGGAPLDPVFLHRWAADAALRAGRRREATVTYGRAVRLNDLRSFVRPLLPLLSQRIARALLLRVTAIDPAWEAAVRPWLDPLLEDSPPDRMVA